MKEAGPEVGSHGKPAQGKFEDGESPYPLAKIDYDIPFLNIALLHKSYINLKFYQCIHLIKAYRGASLVEIGLFFS